MTKVGIVKFSTGEDVGPCCGDHCEFLLVTEDKEIRHLWCTNGMPTNLAWNVSARALILKAFSSESFCQAGAKWARPANRTEVAEVLQYCRVDNVSELVDVVFFEVTKQPRGRFTLNSDSSIVPFAQVIEQMQKLSRGAGKVLIESKSVCAGDIDWHNVFSTIAASRCPFQVSVAEHSYRITRI